MKELLTKLFEELDKTNELRFQLTELIKERLTKHVDKKLLNNFDIKIFVYVPSKEIGIELSGSVDESRCKHESVKQMLRVLNAFVMLIDGLSGFRKGIEIDDIDFEHNFIHLLYLLRKEKMLRNNKVRG